MSFNEQPPPPSSQFLGSSLAFPHNPPAFPFSHEDHEISRQYAPVGDHPDVVAHKKARQSDDNLPNFPPLPLNYTVNPPAISSGGRGIGQIFYKTRLCVKYTDGTCRNGDGCNFAHGVSDLRNPPPNWQELVGGRGSGTGRLDEENRRNYNLKICKRFSNGEECPYGEKCVFLHDRPTPNFLDEGLKGMAERAGDRENSAIIVGLSSNQGRTGGYRSETNRPPLYWKSKPGERSYFDHVQTGTSRVIQSKPPGVAPFGDHVAVTGDPIKKRSKNDDDSRWKLNKKINRIYADWLDDLSPPRNID